MRNTTVIAARQRMPILHMLFQPRPKILPALQTHHNRRNQQQHGKCTKDSQHTSRRSVRRLRLADKHLAQFVHEISYRDEVRHNDEYLAFATLMLDDPCCKHQQCCRERNCRDGEIQLRLPDLQALWTCNYSEKLYREAEKEEKVEFEERDVELWRPATVSGCLHLHRKRASDSHSPPTTCIVS